MEITMSDVAPDDDITEDYEYSCEVCGIELFYAGKGRKPRLCAEHKPKATATTTTKAGKSGNSTDTLIVNIANTYRTVGMAITFYPPASFDGMQVLSSADALAESWRGLMDRDPKVKAMWVKFFTVSGYGAVIAAHMMVLLPILQHHNVIPSPKGATVSEGVEP